MRSGTRPCAAPEPFRNCVNVSQHNRIIPRVVCGCVVCAECGHLAPSEPLVDREYVVPSGDFAEGSVRRLKKEHPHHVSVKRQFFDSWGGGAEVGKIKKGAVQVKRVLEIRVPLAVWKRFVVTRAGGDAKYRAHYAFGGGGEDGCTVCKGCNESKEESNDLLLFHGTSLECRFGIDDEAQICESKSCNVCSILTAGLTLGRAGTGKLGGAVMPLRYGKGLYFSGSSGKSNDCKVTVHLSPPHHRQHTHTQLADCAGESNKCLVPIEFAPRFISGY